MSNIVLHLDTHTFNVPGNDTKQMSFVGTLGSYIIANVFFGLLSLALIEESQCESVSPAGDAGVE